MCNLFSIRFFMGIVLLCSIPNFGQYRLYGHIVDQDTDAPVELARVVVESTKLYCLSDAEGKFSILLPEKKEVDLEISHVAYQTKHFQIIPRGMDSLGVIIHVSKAIIETGTVIIADVHSDHRSASEDLSLILKGKSLQRELGNTLAASLKNEAGVALRSMGPAPARPIIRGLGGDRVQIQEDGFTTNDLSATSPDHAVAIESINADRMEIIRGPKVLLQNASSPGGIVNVINNNIPLQSIPHIIGNANIYAESANKGYAASMETAFPVMGSLGANIIGSYRKTSNLSTPEGTVQNSMIQTGTYGFGTGGNFGYFSMGISVKEYYSNYGVPGGFVGAHPNGVDIEMFKRDVSIIASMENISSTLPTLVLRFNRDYYQHKEFENINLIGAEFSIFNYHTSLEIETKNLFQFDEGSVVLSGDFRDFAIGGFVFTPPVTSRKLAMAAYQKKKLESINFEISLRFESTVLTPHKTERPVKSKYLANRTFNTFSTAASAQYPLSESVSVGMLLSMYARVPTIEELYSEGPHLAAYSYEVGNPDLSFERGYSLEMYTNFQFEKVKGNLNLFHYNIPYYIIPRNSGRINYATLLPVYESSGIYGKLYGIESSINYTLHEDLTVKNISSFTYGVNADENVPLPAIAPLKSTLELQYRLLEHNFGIKGEWSARQDRVDVFESSTSGYFIVGGYYQLSMQTGTILHSFSCMIDNIFDRVYRNHLSRIKVILPEAGRNFRLLYKVIF